MKMNRYLFGLLAGLLLVGPLASGEGLAQGEPPAIKVSLALAGSRVADRQLFLPSDNIVVALTLVNAGGEDVITSAGFGSRPFFLYLTFVGPDGKGIAADSEEISEPLAPQVLLVDDAPLQVEPVEVLPGTASGDSWAVSVRVANARDYYRLANPGKYSVKAVIPMRTYAGIDYTADGVDYAMIDSFDWAGSLESNVGYFTITADRDGDGYYAPEAYSTPYPDCDDNNPNVHPGALEILGNGLDDDCNPGTPDVAAVPMGTVALIAEKHTIGTGSKPPTTKTPIVGMPVKVMDKSMGSCVSKNGVSWQNYMSNWLACPAVASGVTDAAGKASLSVPRGDYLVVGLFDPNRAAAGDELYVGQSVGLVEPNTTVSKYLQVLAKADGKNTPGKYTIRTGSELMVIEPEYVEWTGTQELYPFVFQSMGDWGVTTAISPPEGFIADYKELGTVVNSDLKAVQFTVIDVGSDWVDTVVEHKVKHKNRTEVIKSKIGVRNKQKAGEGKK